MDDFENKIYSDRSFILPRSIYTFVNMELPDRIATIIKVNQHTPASFADALGVQRSSVSHVLNGRNKPSMDFVQKIIEHFPRVDAAWLITGKESGRVPKEKIHNKSTIVNGGLEEIGMPMHSEMDAPGSSKRNANKEIEKIVVFYTDRTFDVYEQ